MTTDHSPTTPRPDWLPAHFAGRPWYSEPLGIDLDAKPWNVHCRCWWVGQGASLNDVLIAWAEHATDEWARSLEPRNLMPDVAAVNEREGLLARVAEAERRAEEADRSAEAIATAAGRAQARLLRVAEAARALLPMLEQHRLCYGLTYQGRVGCSTCQPLRLALAGLDSVRNGVHEADSSRRDANDKSSSSAAQASRE